MCLPKYDRRYPRLRLRSTFGYFRRSRELVTVFRLVAALVLFQSLWWVVGLVFESVQEFQDLDVRYRPCGRYVGSITGSVIDCVSVVSAFFHFVFYGSVESESKCK